MKQKNLWILIHENLDLDKAKLKQKAQYSQNEQLLSMLHKGVK